MLSLLVASAHAFVLPSAPHHVARASSAPVTAAPVMFGLFGGGGGAKTSEPTLQNARDADFARRQEKLGARRAAGAAAPKGQVEITFPQKGNKVVKAMQGDPLGKVCQKAGVKVKFDCKTGRCGTCQVSINGRAKAKICQGATVPGGATRKIKVTLDNY